MQHPTRIQSEVFSYYAYYHDFLIAAQTGSGKTLAFAAPILSELHALKEAQALARFPPRILALILTPTRELAQQIHDNVVLALAGLATGVPLDQQLTVTCIIGGMSKDKQLRVLREHRPQVVIGTPGRLHELLGE
jgi:superfamily II DNA/RNA helicase